MLEVGSLDKGLRMRTIRLPLLLALAAVTVLAAAGGATATGGTASPTADAAQSGATITVPDQCFRERTKIPVTGRGFTPNTPVDVGFASRRPVTRTTDDSGRFTAKVPVPDLGDAPQTGRVRLFAVDRADAANAPSLRVQLTTIGVAASDSFARRGENITFQFSGFPNGRTIWAHYLFNGNQRGKQRMGKADGPCGTLRARKPLIPSFIDRAGTWTIQFDARKKYSRKTEPRLRRKIRVFSVPGRVSVW